MNILFNIFASITLLLCLLLPASGAQFSATDSLAPVASQPADYGKMALFFTANQGQTDPQVAFTIQGSDKTIYFTETGVTFVLSQKPKAADAATKAPGLHPDQFQVEADPTPVERWALKLDFVGARAVRPLGLDKTDTIVSYFKGKLQDWHTAIPTYARIVYPELWPGIDLTYSGTYDRLKYEFTLHPGADPTQIRLAYRSASAVRLNESGQLQVSTPLGDLQDAAPSAYQEHGGKRASVAAAYDLQEPSFGFALGAYDPSYPLVIDPAILVYAGYLGSSGPDEGHGIAVDSSGAAYVTGRTNYGDFPVVGGPDLSFNGGRDAFVAKVASDGSGLVYAGFIGGSSDDEGNGITVDGSGAAYITGYTDSSDFPSLGWPGNSFNGGRDAFVARVAPDGSTLYYSIYLGGSGGDAGQSIDVDNNGMAYVTGNTWSADFPAQVGPDLSYHGTGDGFVARVKADGSGLVYAGFIGGGAWDGGKGIAVDHNGAAYVTGYTGSTDFPALVGPDLSLNGLWDAFVAKVAPNGSGLVYAGFIGSSMWDEGNGIAVDGSGAAYVTGFTDSPEFPVLVGPDLSFNGVEDAFVAKVAPDGSGLVYAGYIGGSGGDHGNGIAVDDDGAAYVIGTTESADFPVLGGPDLSYNWGGDAFVAKVKPNGSRLVYAGFIGGTGSDWGNGIALDDNGAAYVTGYTGSSDFPVLVGPDLSFNDQTDGFIAKISPDDGPPPVLFLPQVRK